DMSQSVLRSVSPIHLEYLGHMGVKASMSISLVRDRQLWGMIACHHNQPKSINFALRSCCEFFGQIVSSELTDKEQKESLESRLKLKSLLFELGESMSASDFLLDGLTQSPQQLMDLANAQGVAFIEQENITLIGDTPPKSAVHALLPALEPKLKTNLVYHTHILSQLVPELVEFKEQASGLLALSISKSQKIYLLWFRPERVRLIHWAGDPHKSQKVDDDGLIHMSPRRSFQKWSETVYLQSDPWNDFEIEAVSELRIAIIGIVLQKADLLAKVNRELTRSNDELASFAYVASHDLKAPLRAIANLASWLQEDLGDQISSESQHHLDILQSRVYRMDEMIDGLLDYSRIGLQQFPAEEVNLPSLLKEIVDSLSPPDTVQISIPLQTPPLTTYKVLLKQVLTNLLSNALKYIGRPDGEIEVVVTDQGDQLQFEVKDNGPGIASEYHQRIFQIFQTLQGRDQVESTGIGLAIVKKAVENQGGEVTVSSTPGKGCNFIFTWPKLLLSETS
ncbi:MAG: ATP-binding protein, partial [Thermosynechococcaceae cyanobacterium]